MPASATTRCDRCGDKISRPPMPSLDEGGLTLCLGCAHPAYRGSSKSSAS